jgi:hypothetical protein
MNTSEFMAPLEAVAAALVSTAGGAIVETTADQTLMRGSEPYDR